MLPNKINSAEWDDRLRRAMVDFANYYASGGRLEQAKAEPSAAAEFAEKHLQLNTVLRFRQEIGGVFTSIEELALLPGFTNDLLEHMAYLVNRLDLSKLQVLAPQTTWNNQVDAYVNGADCLQVMLNEIRRAERYIHLSVMMFFNDQSGKLVAQALLDALARGVMVRVMVDYVITSFGYGKKAGVGDFKGISDQLIAAGGKVINTFHSCYSEMNWPKKRAELETLGVPNGYLFLQDLVQAEILLGLNVVTHRKFMVIDGITSLVGSLNVGDQYLYASPVLTTGSEQVAGRPLGIPRHIEQWHDGFLRIKGAAALPLNELFASQWVVLDGDLFDAKDPFYYPVVMDRYFGDETCTLLSSFPGNPVNLIQQYYLSLVTYAADATIIHNPYLLDQTFWDKLKNLGSEESGHLTICNSLEENDHPTNKAAIRCNMYKPFRNGVSFYDYSHTKRFSHWKTAYDKRSDCVFHGSYNLNERSACHDFELGVLVKGKTFADKMKQIIDYDLQQSRQITDSREFYKYPRLHLCHYFNKSTQYFS